MLFVVRFTDKTDSDMIREQQLAAHISWLDEWRQTVLVAGSLREDPEANPIGAFWVVEAERKSAFYVRTLPLMRGVKRSHI